MIKNLKSKLQDGKKEKSEKNPPSNNSTEDKEEEEDKKPPSLLGIHLKLLGNLMGLFYFSSRDDQVRIDDFRYELGMLPMLSEFKELMRSINSILLKATYTINNYHMFIDLNHNNNNYKSIVVPEKQMDTIWVSLDALLNDIDEYNRLYKSEKVKKSPLTKSLIDNLKQFTEILLSDIKHGVISNQLKSIATKSINEYKSNNKSFEEFLSKRINIEKRLDDDKDGKNVIISMSDDEIELIQSSLSFLIKLELNFDKTLLTTLAEYKKSTNYDKNTDTYISNMMSHIKTDELFNSKRTLLIKTQLFYRNLLVDKTKELTIKMLDSEAIKSLAYCFSIKPNTNTTTQDYLNKMLESSISNDPDQSSRSRQEILTHLSFMLSLVSESILTKSLAKTHLDKILTRLNKSAIYNNVVVWLVRLAVLLLYHYNAKRVYNQTTASLSVLMSRIYAKCLSLLSEIEKESSSWGQKNAIGQHDIRLRSELAKLVEVL